MTGKGYFRFGIQEGISDCVTKTPKNQRSKTFEHVGEMFRTRGTASTVSHMGA